MLRSLFIQIKSCLVDGAHCTVLVAILAFTRGVIASSIPVANEKWLKGCLAGCILHLDVSVRLDRKVSDFVREFRGYIERFCCLPIIICCNKGEKCVATDCHVEKSAQAINYDKGVLFPEKLSDGVGLLNLASRLILLLFSLYAVVGLVFCVAIDSITSKF